MRRNIITLTVLVATAVTLTQAATSDSLSFATFKEKQGRVTVVVGSLPASLADGDGLIPLQVAVGVHGKGPELAISDEAFTLIDQDGTEYPMASLEAVRGSGRQLFHRSLNRASPLAVGKSFRLLRRVPSSFYPVADLRYDRVHLPREHFFSDVLYFPAPDAGLGGVMTLRFDVAGLDEPVNVRFEVPLRSKQRS